MKIGIDAGHGGKNVGAVVNRVKEKDLNLSIAIKTAHLIRSVSEHRITMSRYADEHLSQADRRIALAHCDLVISIHCNAIYVPSVSGAEAYYNHEDKCGKRICKEILAAMPIELTPTRVRDAFNNPDDPRDDWMDAPINVLRHKKAVLIECGYMTNPSEFDYLTRKDGQLLIASAIAGGILQVSIDTKTIKEESHGNKRINDDQSTGGNLGARVEPPHIEVGEGTTNPEKSRSKKSKFFK